MKYRTDLSNIVFMTAFQSALRVLAFIATGLLLPSSAIAQQDINETRELPAAQWLEFKKARYGQRPILVHLRNGFERAILMPEPIRIMEGESLPGTAIEIDTDVIGFFPTRTFARQAISFVGLESGTVYELRIRASPNGLIQPLQITR